MLRSMSRYKTHRDGDDAPAGSIFVFGSNLAGRHGAGAAKAAAFRYGAQYGVGAGRTGQSYAIPTKGYQLEVLDLSLIALHIENFKKYAWEHMGETFFITRVGCGLAGYQDKDIAPLFVGITDNVSLPVQWERYIKIGSMVLNRAPNRDYICIPG